MKRKRTEKRGKEAKRGKKRQEKARKRAAETKQNGKDLETREKTRTAALDSVSRDKLIALLSGLTDKTILSITHDLEFANSMGRIITIKRQ